MEEIMVRVNEPNYHGAHFYLPGESFGNAKSKETSPKAGQEERMLDDR